MNMNMKWKLGVYRMYGGYEIRGLEYLPVSSCGLVEVPSQLARCFSWGIYGEHLPKWSPTLMPEEAANCSPGTLRSVRPHNTKQDIQPAPKDSQLAPS